MRRRLCLAFINVCRLRVREGKWLPLTAFAEMKRSSAWMERVAPNSTKLPIWKDVMHVFQKFQHKRNKAPIMTWPELQKLAESCVSTRHRAIFWLAVMTCSRIGNLDGLEVEEHSDVRANDSHTPQDSLECQPDVRYTALLERNHEEPNSGFYSARKDNNRGDERSRKELKNEQFKEAFDKENLVQRLCRLFGPHRQDKGNHEACVSGIFPRVCGEYKPNYRYISPHWHGYLP